MLIKLIKLYNIVLPCMSVTWALPFKEKIIPEIGKERAVDPEEYKRIHQESLKDIEAFWSNIARELEWFKPWDKVLAADPQPPFYKWFVGGRLNASYLALDRHVKGGRKNKVAIIWEGEPVDQNGNPLEVRKLTYYDLWREVNRLATYLRTSSALRRAIP